MAQIIQLRQGNASIWTSINPILSNSEIGIEIDTGKFKLGDGLTTWNSLIYNNVIGPTQTQPYRSFGDGSDGNVTINSGTTFLTQDMYYNNLTLTGTGKLYFNGYKVFIKDTLNLTAAGIGALQADGGNGGDATGSTGGTIASIYSSGSLGSQSPATAGAIGATGVGVVGAAVTAITGNGGLANSSGAGGTGNGNNGGASSVGAAITSMSIRNYRTNMFRGVTLLTGGIGGRGGSSGGGDGATVTGGGGGAGGNGGGIVCLYANKIVTSSITPSRTISCFGGNGGTGGAPSGTGGGGGGGGAGGGGGWIYICYNKKFGPQITNLIMANGGNGGLSAAGTNGTNSGGGGGQGGYGGRINLISISDDIGSSAFAFTDPIYNPEITAQSTLEITGSAHQGASGGILGISL